MGKKQLVQPTLSDTDQLPTAPTGTGGRPNSAPGAEFNPSREKRSSQMSAFPLEAIFQAAVDRKSMLLTASSISTGVLFP